MSAPWGSTWTSPIAGRSPSVRQRRERGERAADRACAAASGSATNAARSRPVMIGRPSPSPASSSARLNGWPLGVDEVQAAELDDRGGLVLADVDRRACAAGSRWASARRDPRVRRAARGSGASRFAANTLSPSATGSAARTWSAVTWWLPWTSIVGDREPRRGGDEPIAGPGGAADRADHGERRSARAAERRSAGRSASAIARGLRQPRPQRDAGARRRFGFARTVSRDAVGGRRGRARFAPAGGIDP